MARVSVEGIVKRYGTVAALDEVSLDFEDGGLFALLGPSGSGKTTLLRAIAGFVFPDRGRIRIGDQPVERVPVEKRDIGMMFQNYALFPNMSVADNVGFGLRVRKVGAAEERRRVGEALELVQLEGFGGRKPHELSGGQRQRVALARAIVTNPRVLLLDEPLSALDKALRVDMQFELRRIQREIGITTILVTHDQEEALTLSDRIGILRDGRLVQAGPPREVYDAPADLFAATFLGEANILPGVGAGLVAPEGAAPGAVLAVRPEAIAMTRTEPEGAGLSRCAGVLERRVFAGAMATCLVRREDGGEMKVVSRDQDIPAGLAEGELVWLSWPVEKTLVIPAGAQAGAG
ncbi:ABC transporter ATP-binding protein [Roseovarius sp.]|uniref:ABC transporter ATP-binding protein n=1 Tax=Roseovarius sp. TaxID=1486281 RepID=UPI003BA9A996